MPPLDDEMMAHALDLLKWGVLPALGASAVVMIVMALAQRGKQAALASALAVSAGAGLGFWLRGTVEWMPGESPWNRLPWAALGALWAGRIARFPQLQPSAAWLLRAAASIVVAWLVIPKDSRVEFEWLAPAYAATVFGLWVLLERLAAEPPDGSVPFCAALAFLAAGAVLIHANTDRLLNASVVMSAAFAGLALAAWICRAEAGGALPAAAVLLPGVLLMGHQTTFSEIPWYAFALPAFAPFVLAEALPLSHWQSVRLRIARALLMVVLILIPLAVAVYLADQAAPLTGEPQP